MSESGNVSFEYTKEEIFPQGSKYTDTFQTSLGSIKKNLESIRTELSTVFVGNIATSADEGFETLEGMIDDICVDLTNISKYLKDYLEGSKKANEESAGKFLEVKDGYISIKQNALSGNTNRAKVANFALTELGYNEAATYGLIEGLAGESYQQLDHNAVNPYSGAYGIAQWLGSRQTALINYCNQNGLDYRTLEGQLGYLKYELNTSESYTNSLMKQVPNTAEGARQAAYIWTVYFERCENSASSGAQRGAKAAELFNSSR